MVSKTYMVWLSPSLSWQTQQTHQYLDQGRDECFGCRSAVLPCIQQYVHDAEQQGCQGAHSTVRPALVKDSLPNCRFTGRGFPSKLQSQLSWLQALYAIALSHVT